MTVFMMRYTDKTHQQLLNHAAPAIKHSMMSPGACRLRIISSVQ
ncbi:MAG TPA: hypothetical protein DEB17_01790 [Chlorobaculum sp.]|uniref:Uncharacterized protein n=1 Tax=Chlorobaculum tepidum (strain ATCC 49652 / DSM 12025 / NBRC 103806 / TLS) TaxID=194439 RepID=Q8KDG9_CHLTE|nr:hypothetical protein CT1081 [Chlorobaculum tepidum TLS]HBU22731.1 hypothetical protein [Chlorobaculum sp.]